MKSHRPTPRASHPEKIRTVTCRHWKRGNCELDDRCNFLHGDGANVINAAPEPEQRETGFKYHPGFVLPGQYNQIDSVNGACFLMNGYKQQAPMDHYPASRSMHGGYHVHQQQGPHSAMNTLDYVDLATRYAPMIDRNDSHIDSTGFVMECVQNMDWVPQPVNVPSLAHPQKNPVDYWPHGYSGPQTSYSQLLTDIPPSLLPNHRLTQASDDSHHRYHSMLEPKWNAAQLTPHPIYPFEQPNAQFHNKGMFTPSHLSSNLSPPLAFSAAKVVTMFENTHPSQTKYSKTSSNSNEAIECNAVLIAPAAVPREQCEREKTSDSTSYELNSSVIEEASFIDTNASARYHMPNIMQDGGTVNSPTCG